MHKMLTLFRLRVLRLWKVILLLSGVGTALSWLWWHQDFMGIQGSEKGAYDDGLGAFADKWWFPWGQTQRSGDIVIVAIDDSTFADVAAFAPWRDRYGSWPYDRIIWSDVLSYLNEAGARLVVFDATIDEPKSDVTGDLRLGQTVGASKVPFALGFNIAPNVEPLPKVDPVNRVGPPPPAAPPDAGTAAAEEEFPSEDFPSDEQPDPAAAAKARAEAAAKLKERTAAAYAFPVRFQGGLDASVFPTVDDLALPDGGVPSEEQVASKEGLIKVPRARYPIPAIDPLLDVVSGFGTVLQEADDDGKMRRTSFAYSDGANSYVTLSVAAVADLMGVKEVTVEPGKLRIGTHVVDIDKDGTAKINFGGPLADRFTSVPLADVLRYRARKSGHERFKDKIVLIAGFALGTADVKATPFESQVPGVVKQASEIDNLLHNRFIISAPFWVSLLFAFIIALITVVLVMVVQNAVVDIGAPVFLYFFFYLVTGGFLVATRWHVIAAMASMAGTLASVATTAFNRFFANKERDNLRQAFALFMEEDALNLLVEGRRLPSLKGEERVMTLAVTCLQGADVLRPEPRRLLEALNRTFSMVTPIIKSQEGCVDKYEGHAVVAMFGAPLDHPDHALRACRCAVEVREALKPLRAQFKEEGFPPMWPSTAIHTGALFVGNMGSADVVDYTALGPVRDDAMAWHPLNVHFGSAILLGPATVEAVGTNVVTRPLGRVQVGKGPVVPLAELVGMAGQVDAATLEVLTLYQRALELHDARRFAEAVSVLEKAVQLRGDDGPSVALLLRCQRLAAVAPPADWDGVTRL